MLKKTLFICICFHVAALVLAGCCNCDHVQNFNFKWTWLSLSNYSYTAGTELQKSRDTTTDYTSKNYMLHVHLNYELTAIAKPQIFSLYNSVYACKCIGTQYHPDKRPVTVSVKCLNDFDSSHKTGDDITGYFKYAHYNLSSGKFEGFEPITAVPSQEYIFGEPDENYSLFLTQKPNNTGLQQFEVTISFSDNIVLSEKSIAIQLK